MIVLKEAVETWETLNGQGPIINKHGSKSGEYWIGGSRSWRTGERRVEEERGRVDEMYSEGEREVRRRWKRLMMRLEGDE